MPSALVADMERNGSGGGGGGGGETLDDQRALQIALDQLSLLGLDNDETGSIYDSEPRKKSVNMTECVPVPSSEHVAEIVGRQGGGNQENNKNLSLPPAEKLKICRRKREENGVGAWVLLFFSPPPKNPPKVRNRALFLRKRNGVGKWNNGTGIKHPQWAMWLIRRDKEPVFEVTGMPENVDRAREEIEAHIAMRTGGIIELTDENDFHANGTDVGFELNGTGSLWSK
ncbi:RNA-binding protein MEX3B, partial [Cuculus canorus]